MYPSYEERIEDLKTLEAMLKSCRKGAEEALSEDFRTHPPQLTMLIELLMPLSKSRYIRENLKKWMKPQPRHFDRVVHGESRNYVMYQPLGVVGNMAAWNAPFMISLGPLLDILAAGNRAIIKPSELAPATGKVLKEIVSRSFKADHVAVVTGEVDLAQEFATMPWDHLVYTGGQAVGKLVMKAAAENLTPVTLELGGKCSVIIAEDSVNETTVSAILSNKIMKGGQVCIAPDYVLVPETQKDAFVSLCQEILPRMLPSYTNHPQSTGIINERHLDRLLSYLEDAEQKGARLIQLYDLDESVNREDRKPPFTLILDLHDEMEAMRNEIFGPILPVLTYNALNDAISYINAHERPLALYFYTKNKKQAKDLLMRTISGGACINSMCTQVMIPSLPFGGVGYSGMGRYGGFEGFQTFSNQRSIFEMGKGILPEDTFYPPYGETLDGLLNFAFMRE